MNKMINAILYAYPANINQLLAFHQKLDPDETDGIINKIQPIILR